MDYREEKQNKINEVQGEIRDLIKDTDFTVQQEEYDMMILATRENGNVGDEEFGQKDYEAAQKLEAVLYSKYRGLLSTSVDVVGEWVNIEISFN